MPKRTSRPITGDVALIDAADLPAPESAVHAVNDNPAAVRLAWQQYAAPKVIGCGAGVEGFQICEAEKAMEIEPPPNPKSHWGGLAHHMHAVGDLEPVVAEPGKKRTVRGSLLYRWRVTPEARAKYLAKQAQAATEQAVAA
jgi:hypothetical protein